MTIKELCKNTEHCIYCPFKCVCNELKLIRVEYINNYDADKMTKSIIETAKMLAPSKTGHWITTRTFMHDGEYYCDKCKCNSPNNEKWVFCPNCGAKMILTAVESEVDNNG